MTAKKRIQKILTLFIVLFLLIPGITYADDDIRWQDAVYMNTETVDEDNLKTKIVRLINNYSSDNANLTRYGVTLLKAEESDNTDISFRIGIQDLKKPANANVEIVVNW